MAEREMVIRPSPTLHPYRWLGYPAVVLFWLGGVYLATHPTTLNGMFSGYLQDPRGSDSLDALLVLLPLGCLCGLASLRTSSLYLTATHIGCTRFARAPVVCPRSVLARIVVFSEHHPSPSIYKPDGYKVPVIVFESRQGGELFRLTSRWWDLADVHSLAAACGVAVEGSWRDVREKDEQSR